MTIINYKLSPSSGFRHHSASYNFATMCFHLGPDFGYKSKGLEKFCDDASGLQRREYLKRGRSLTCQEDKWSLNIGRLKKSLTLVKNYPYRGLFWNKHFKFLSNLSLEDRRKLAALAGIIRHGGRV